MASYIPITEKPTTEVLNGKDKIIVIQDGGVKQYDASEVVKALEIVKAMETVGTSVGNSDISEVGDGTLTGAIAKLFEMVSAIPKITSGIAEPTGGSDGDVYVMYEEE